MAALALLFPVSLLADISGYVTLSVNSTYNLDTATAGIGAGDIRWDGATIAPLGTATLANWGVLPLGAPEIYSGLVGQLIAATFSTTPLGSGQIVPGDVILVHTNGGNWAWAQIFAASSSSLTLWSYTLGPVAPAIQITRVQNNYSYIAAGPAIIPVAPGSLFIVAGSGLADPAAQAVLQDSTQGLPSALNGASITVTVGGVASHPALYYAIAAQLAAVLPSDTPLGAGTITVTYHGASSTAPILVQPVSLGVATLIGNGTGQAIATEPDYSLVGLSHPAKPGDVITFWGSGLGASPGVSDTTYSAVAAPITVNGSPLQVYIGGVAAGIQYQGRSPYPGLDQINVTVPAGVLPGCFVSVAMVSGSVQEMVESNFFTIPVSAGGGACSDATAAISGSQAEAWSTRDAIHIGVVGLELTPSGGGSVLLPAAAFSVVQGAILPLVQLSSGWLAPVSAGSCMRTPPSWLPLPPAGAASFPGRLDAGDIKLSGLGEFEWLQEYDFLYG